MNRFGKTTAMTIASLLAAVLLTGSCLVWTADPSYAADISWHRSGSCTPSSAPSDGVLYEETDLDLVFTGSWRSSSDPSHSGRSALFALRPGAALTIEFTGTSLTWIAPTSFSCGLAQVTLDDGAPQLVDLYSPQPLFRQEVYHTGPLAAGPHTLRIEQTGMKNPRAHNSYIYVDALRITSSLEQAETAVPAPQTLSTAPTTSGPEASLPPALPPTTDAGPSGPAALAPAAKTPTATTVPAPVSPDAPPPEPEPAPLAAAASYSSLTPTLAITSPTGTSTYPAGSSLRVRWNSDQALYEGEFGLWVRSTENGWYATRLVAASGSSSYSATLYLTGLASGWYQAIVAYRPVAGSGPWVSWATSPGAFSVGTAPLSLSITAPTGWGSYSSAGTLPVAFTSSGRLTSGRFALWVRSASDSWYLGQLVPATGSTSYSVALALRGVVPGSGYQAIVAYEPIVGSGLWTSWATSPGVFSVYVSTWTSTTSTPTSTTTTTKPPSTTTTSTTTFPPISTTTTTISPSTTTTSTVPAPTLGGTLNVRDYGAKGDGVTDDSAAIQRALSACPSGGTVTLPAGRYRLASTVSLKSNVTLRGAGSTQSVLLMTGKAQVTSLLYVPGLTNTTVSHIGLQGSGSEGKEQGINFNGCADCTLTNVRFDDLSNGIGLSGNVSRGLHVSDIVARDCITPLYLSACTDSLFERLDIDGRYKPASDLDHTVYIAADVSYCTFNDCTFTGGSGWTLHFYGAFESKDPNGSHHITFNNSVIDVQQGNYPIIICEDYSEIAFNNTTIYANNSTEYKCAVWFYGGRNVTFDGFAATGCDRLAFVPYDNGETSDVLFRNGTFDGQHLSYGAGAGVVTMTNVSLM